MKKILFVILIVCISICCGNNDKINASKIYNNALSFYSKNMFDSAKIELDLLHSTFPRQVEYRRKADTLLWKITIDKINLDMPVVDSTLQILVNQAESIAKNYKFIKNEKYQTIGDYEHTSIQNALNTDRTYLKPITDEHGNFRIISNLVGKGIKHRSIVASTGSSSAETAVVSDDESNSYNDFGVNYESVNFNENNVKDLLYFMGNNANSPIKITLKGEKKDYSYNISKNDVKVILETYDFSKILKEIYINQLKKKEMQQIFENLNMKMTKTKRM